MITDDVEAVEWVCLATRSISLFWVDLSSYDDASKPGSCRPCSPASAEYIQRRLQQSRIGVLNRGECKGPSAQPGDSPTASSQSCRPISLPSS